MARLTPQQIEQIVTYAEGDKWGTWISRIMKIPAATVNYQMLIHGYDPWRAELCNKRHQTGGFSAEEDEQMLRLSREGKGPSAIGRIMKRAQTSIRIRILTLEVRAERALERAA